MAAWRDYLAENESAWYEEVLELLRIPSISTDPERASDVAATAEWVAARMKKAGIPEVEIVAGPGHPLVTGQWIVPNKPRVLIYGHYDVQPVEPLELWISPPFEPTVRDGKIYARGSGDMKANLSEEQKQFFRQQSLFRDRLGRPEDVAAMASFLLSDDGAFVTGQVMCVDGGATCRP